ncbi:MAG: hypothetical protein H6974_15185 [Gammaproteobacteria bacterium]|nr:hypothetical protein [Gammaproteobacteria bacterium]
MNCTFKHEFVFRHEVNTLADLKALRPAFQSWYNKQRLHCRFIVHPLPFWPTRGPLYSLKPRKSFGGAVHVACLPL